MKKIISFVIMVVMICSVAHAAPIHKYEEVIPVAPGINLTQVQEFHADYNMNYSYIKADLTNKNVKLELLKSRSGVDVADTVNNLAKGNKEVVAALNADFFSIQSGNKGFALGIEIDDGDLKQSPIYPSTMATISYMKNKVSMSYLKFDMKIIAPNGKSSPVRHFNKHTTYYGDILVYTKEFNGGMSPAPGGPVVELVVDNGKVVELRKNKPSVKIPENGYVFVVSEWVSMFLTNNFKVGDPVKFEYTISPDISSAETAVGGGAMLVENGKEVTQFSHVISGDNPRSAIGMNKEGTVLYLVAVDGRQKSSKGMSMSELAKLMKSLGCYNAINLDGGGSTNMVASTMWEPEIHTVNSKTENRKVINAVGLSYTGASDGKPYKIDIKKDEEVVFIGNPVKISALAYDSAMKPVADRVVLSSQYGTIKNDVFTPDKAGQVYVNAKCGTAQGQTSVYVIDKIIGIDVDSYIRLTTGDSYEFDMNVFDSSGRYVSVTNTGKFTITSSNAKVVSVSGRKLKALSAGTAIITIKKDNVVSYISVAVDNVGGGNTKFKAPSANKYSQSAVASQNKMLVGAVYGEGSNILVDLVNSKVRKTITKNTIGAIIGEPGSFKSYETDQALCMYVDTFSGGIRSTAADQWGKIANAISSTKKKNVFVFSSNSIFGDSEFENNVIKDYFAALDKKVFVVTTGPSNTYKNINGVNYFTIGNMNGVNVDTTYISNYKYLVFHFGTNVTFEWKKWF